MRWILNITLAAEVLVALLWTVAMWTETGSSGIAVLGWFAVVVVVYGVCFLIGSVIAWRCPPLRRRAGIVMVVPLVGLFTPYALRTLTGGAIELHIVWRVAVTLLLAGFCIALLRPRATAKRLPRLLFRSRGLNLAVVGVLVVAWFSLVLAGVWLLTDPGQDALRHADRTSNGMATAFAVLAASAYLLMIGAGSVVSGAWGWLGLMGGVEGARRRIHLVQLVGALPGIMVAAATWAWLIAQR
ncbi:MAG: hypothetical protein V2I25_01350 [Woeseiaceae bacterium]|jgi:hypothetical protein|nr:hypothetical protein [Woeseiaceae bacterium]